MAKKKEFYTLDAIAKLCKDLDFHFACLEDANGIKLIAYNNARSGNNIEKQFTKIKKRLESTFTVDGIYYVRATSSLFNSKPYELFPVKKGNANPEEIKEIESAPAQANLLPKQNFKMSDEEILKMITDNATMRAEKDIWLRTIDQQQARIEELEIEIEEMEAKESEALGEKKDFLSEHAPTLINLAERLIDKMGTSSQIPSAPQVKKAPSVKIIKPATPEHVIFIDALFNDIENPGKKERFESELMKVSEIDPALFQDLVKKYDLTFEEQEEQ